MTTSPRVALCVVLGSWGALLVAAGVAGERQSHAISHRLAPAPHTAGIEHFGAAALAGIHLDYLYTDDACGHTAPIPACGMTVCHPFDRPVEVSAAKPAPTNHYCEYDEDYENYNGEYRDASYANDDNYNDGFDDESRYYDVLRDEYSPTVEASKPAAAIDYSENYDYEYENYEYGNYDNNKHSESNYGDGYSDENYDDENRYYDVLGEEHSPSVETSEPAKTTGYSDDVYYDDLTGEYIPFVTTPKASSISETNDDPYYDDLTGEYIPAVTEPKNGAVAETTDAPYYDDYEDEFSSGAEVYGPKVNDENEWDDGAQGWYADPQDTDNLDANIWDADLPNVNATQTPANIDLPYYGEDDPCDDWCSRYEPRVVTGSLAELTANPYHSIGQALVITLNFENDGLPKVQFSAAPQVIAHLMSIETMPNLPAWMYGDFTFEEDWQGCTPHSTNESLPSLESNADYYPGCELERTPSAIPESTWKENRIHNTSSFIWDECYEDYCHTDLDCPSDADRAVSLAIRQEVIRLGWIPTAWSLTLTWDGYRALWNDIAGGVEQFAQDLAVVTKWADSARNSASANRPLRAQPNLHLGL